MTHNNYALLHIYRSDRKAWSTQVTLLVDHTKTQNAARMKLSHYDAAGVVYAGYGLVGWVDLWWGVLLCNVLDEKPTIRFVTVTVPVPDPCETTEFAILNPRPDR